MARLYSKGVVALLIVLFTGLFIYGNPCTRTAYADQLQPVMTRAALKARIAEYQQLLGSNTIELRDFKENYEWLNLKIKEMEDNGRFVPDNMRNSLHYKKIRIESLEKNRQRIEKHLEHLKASEGAMKPMMPGIEAKTHSPVQEAGSSRPGSEDVGAGELLHKSFKETLTMKIEKSNLGDWVTLVDEGGCYRLESSLPILFPMGSAVIAAEYKSFFKDLAQVIKEYDVRVLVNGYADPDPIHTKQYPSNFELGAARAANVVHELIKYGIKPSVFEIATTGNHRMKAKGMSDKKTLERRADLIIVFPG